MIPVARVGEPPDFDLRARQPGNAWLATHPDAKRPRDYWSAFRADLAHGFGHRCGYCAIFLPACGTVDHFHSWHTHPTLAYEWHNYRYAVGAFNSMKRDRPVLDPYEVGDGWFEVVLPSLQLRHTARVPSELVSAAQYTAKLLNRDAILQTRVTWYELYKSGEIDKQQLRKFAPLIADAV